MVLLVDSIALKNGVNFVANLLNLSRKVRQPDDFFWLFWDENDFVTIRSQVYSAASGHFPEECARDFIFQSCGLQQAMTFVLFIVCEI